MSVFQGISHTLLPLKEGFVSHLWGEF